MTKSSGLDIIEIKITTEIEQRFIFILFIFYP